MAQDMQKFNPFAPISLTLVLEFIVYTKKSCCRDEFVDPDVELACTSCTNFVYCAQSIGAKAGFNASDSERLVRSLLV